METYIDLFLDVLCISIPIGILVICAILGIRMRIRSANELWKQVNQSHYGEWRGPTIFSRARTIAAMQIFAMLIMLALLILWFVFPAQEIRVALPCVFGVVLGILLIMELLRQQLLRKK